MNATALGRIREEQLLAVIGAFGRICGARESFTTGARFVFDGQPSKLAVSTRPEVMAVAPALAPMLPSDALLWEIKQGGYLLPSWIETKAAFLVVQGHKDDRLIFAGPDRVCQYEAEPGLVIEIACKGWLWISPVRSTLRLISIGQPLPKPVEASSKPVAVTPIRVFRRAIAEPIELIARIMAESSRFTSYPRNPSGSTFDPWRDSEYEDDDRYHVLKMEAMSASFRIYLINALAPLLKTPRSYIQVNRYNTGDYVLPHRDQLSQGLAVLTASRVDGLVAQSGPEFVRVSDEPGTIVLADPRAWHWVDPVRKECRLTIVTIPPLDAP